jgi:arylsulfatase A-like enzyme
VHTRASGRTRLVVAMAVAVLAMTAGCSSSTTAASAGHRDQTGPTSAGRPNIVFVLTDDLTQDLVRYMPHVLAMERRGTSFTNYTVTDSQCCPSRSSIFTGDYPHDTGVFTNTPPWGGYRVFRGRGEEQSTFAVALHDHGYRTAFMGKYLNGYETGSTAHPITPRPPGWDEWDGVGFGYDEFDYDIAHNETTRFYGHEPADYLTDVLQQRATSFIRSASTSRQPFLLEVATFTPHTPSVPAPRDAAKFPRLTAPRSPAFDMLPRNPPAWLAGRPPLTSAAIRGIDRRYRRRARDVLSIDRLLGAIQQTLADAGASRNTVVVFSSDNGYHLGEHRLAAGKMTAFDTDIEVPLVITGPHVRQGVTNRQAVQNIDLAPTFEELAGLHPSSQMDGVSIVDLLRERVTAWSNAALVEHHGPDTDVKDPDYPGPHGANPPSYRALRTARYTYVEYADGTAELYDRRHDPFELDNVVDRVSPRLVTRLHDQLVALSHCHGVVECTAARKAR